MVTIKTLLKGVGRIAQEVVGDMLSRSGNEPSVYIARRSQPYSNYPFIIIDKMGGPTTGGWGLAKYIDGDGVLSHENTYQYIISIQVYDKADSSGNERASDIISKLKDYIKQVPSVRSRIKEYSTATLEQVFEVTDRTFATKDGYVHSYGFNVTLVATSIIKEEEADFMTMVDLDVDLMRHEEDPDPMKIVIEQELQD